MEDTCTILSIQDSDKTMKSLRKLNSDIRIAFKPFVKSADYLDFLVRTNSEVSKSEETKFNKAFIKAKHIVGKSLEEIRTFRMDLVESSSYLSSASSERRKHRLDLLKKEAAIQKEKLKLEEEEIARKAEVNRKKQELEINLKLLKQENNFMEDESRDLPSLDLNSEDKENLTRKYIENLNLCESDTETPEPDRTIPIPTPFRPNQNFSKNNVPLRPSAPAFYPSNPRFTPQHVQYEPVPAVSQFRNLLSCFHNMLCLKMYFQI